MSGKYGQIFFKERPYAVASTPKLFAQTERGCNHCLKAMAIDDEKPKRNRCKRCRYALYCSKECHVSGFIDTIEIFGIPTHFLSISAEVVSGLHASKL